MNRHYKYLINLMNYNGIRSLQNLHVHKISLDKTYYQGISFCTRNFQICHWARKDDIRMCPLKRTWWWWRWTWRANQQSGVSEPNPFDPPEEPTNSEGQFIVFSNRRLTSGSLRIRPNVYPTFLLTARYSIIQYHSHKKRYHHVLW